MKAEHNIIIGVDPGSQFLGYGLLEIKGQNINYLASGVISNSKLNPNERMGFFRQSLDAIIQQYNPDLGVIEKVFLGKNPQSIFRLGLARGVAISCLAFANVEMIEISPTQMKKSLTGSGHAEKSSIVRTVKALLKIGSDYDLAVDAADALGLSYVFARSYLLQKRMNLKSNVSVRI